MCQKMLAQAQNFCIKCINLPTANMPVLALIGQRIWDGFPNLHAYVPIWPKGCMFPLCRALLHKHIPFRNVIANPHTRTQAVSLRDTASFGF